MTNATTLAQAEDADEESWVVLHDGDLDMVRHVLAVAAAAGIDYAPSALRQFDRAAHRPRGCPMCRFNWHHPLQCPEPDEPEAASKFALYRLITAEDRVLYVGVTRNLTARLRAHRRNWGQLFVHALVEWYPDAESMMEAEAQAIHDEQPPLNAEGIG